MNKLEEVVEISESCLNNMMRNIVEQKENESIGDIIGEYFPLPQDFFNLLWNSENVIFSI